VISVFRDRCGLISVEKVQLCGFCGAACCGKMIIEFNFRKDGKYLVLARYFPDIFFLFGNPVHDL